MTAVVVEAIVNCPSTSARHVWPNSCVPARCCDSNTNFFKSAWQWLQGRQEDLIKAKGLRPDAQSQVWMTPCSITSLLEEVKSAKASGKSVRMVGGNTGPGVYKDWPVDVDVLIGTAGVQELTSITSHKVCCSVQ